ncbi:MAG: hypothetical protein GX263_09790 [Firmicutes bacterium]|nr:hypothetical protein [Bacillota bacterium]
MDNDLKDVKSGKQYSGHSNLKNRKDLKKQDQKTVVFFVLALLLWAGLIAGGYFFSMKHLQETEQNFLNQINALQQENKRIQEDITATMQLLHDELGNFSDEIAQVRGEMIVIQEELELTGESLTGTDQTRLSLQERITELDGQLAALKEQLRKLEEAVRAL